MKATCPQLFACSDAKSKDLPLSHKKTFQGSPSPSLKPSHSLKFCLQEHYTGQRKRKHLATLKGSMLKGSPFPRLHAKAAETKAMLQPVSAALLHFAEASS